LTYFIVRPALQFPVDKIPRPVLLRRAISSSMAFELMAAKLSFQGFDGET
jgi:hypothetical protein